MKEIWSKKIFPSQPQRSYISKDQGWNSKRGGWEDGDTVRKMANRCVGCTPWIKGLEIKSREE